MGSAGYRLRHQRHAQARRAHDEPRRAGTSCEIRRTVTCFGFGPRLTRAPPALTTSSLPWGVNAERTATTCGQPFGLASETRSTGEPKVSARARSRGFVRATLPVEPISARPRYVSRIVLRAGG